MQQVPLSNIIMSMKSPKRSIVKNGLFGYFRDQAVLSARSSRQRQRQGGSSRGVVGNVLVAECMNDITSHLASCHLFKCSKVND